MVLQDRASITSTRETNVRERTWLADQLRRLGLRVFPSAANYLLVKIDEAWNGLDFWRRLIVEHRVVIRSCANFEGLDEHYFRLGVRTRIDNQKLVEAFSAVLRFASHADLQKA
jgi:threonine-phosphate decarboxylase